MVSMRVYKQGLEAQSYTPDPGLLNDIARRTASSWTRGVDPCQKVIQLEHEPERDGNTPEGDLLALLFARGRLVLDSRHRLADGGTHETAPAHVDHAAG